MKYIGSKYRFAKIIVPILQNIIDNNKITTYVEPFVGGANIIDKINCENRIGYDNDYLIIDLLSNPVVENLPDTITKEHYYHVRDNPLNYNKNYRSAILFFGSYNSRVYGGCFGGFAKTKDGKIRNYFLEAKRNFEKQIPLLKNITFENKDFFELDIKDALIYCDPPYSSGIGYKQSFDTVKYWDKVRELSKNNIVICSEYEAPNDFECIWEKEIKTHLNNRNKINKTEKLFVFKNRTPQGKGEKDE